MAKMIAKDKGGAFLNKLDGYEVYGPVEEDGLTLFRKLEGTPALNFKNSQKPPKHVFFPQTERMFNFRQDGTRIVGVDEIPVPEKPILLFGIRPCDARAVKVLDELFSWDYDDPYYAKRRENSVIISLSCTSPTMPGPNCFCTSVGGSPGSTEGSDMLFTDIGNAYYVEVVTEKGNDIITAASDLFTDAGPDADKTADVAKSEAAESIVRELDTEGVVEALEASFDSDYWDEFAQRCLGCGICTLLCPTCHCFDINDIRRKGEIWRERTWDSCQYPYYSIHASNHNPRPEKKHRQRNRIYHKFLYSEKNLGLLGCVGCGRCITGCPVNIDIIQVVEGVKEVEE